MGQNRTLGNTLGTFSLKLTCAAYSNTLYKMSKSITSCGDLSNYHGTTVSKNSIIYTEPKKDTSDNFNIVHVGVSKQYDSVMHAFEDDFIVH